MRKLLLLVFVTAYCFVASAQNATKFYLYGLKYVHDEWLRIDKKNETFFYKSEKSKREIAVKKVNGKYYIVPGLGKCKIVSKYRNDEFVKGITYTIIDAKGGEGFYHELQGCDKPGEAYPLSCN